MACDIFSINSFTTTDRQYWLGKTSISFRLKCFLKLLQNVLTDCLPVYTEIQNQCWSVRATLSVVLKDVGHVSHEKFNPYYVMWLNVPSTPTTVPL